MMKIDGAPLKRYRLSYWGTPLGSYDTAAEAVRELDEHNRIIRPVIDRANNGQYSVRDRSQEITIADLRKIASVETQGGIEE